MTVAIIGAGVAGLNAARVLAVAGVSFELFEARDRLGGRVLTVDSDGRPAADGFDLGPSWFWPEVQPAMARVVAELGLESFPQRSDGDVVFERMSREPAQRYTGRQPSSSRRLVGGSAALVHALEQRLPAARLHRSAAVVRLEWREGEVRVHHRTSDGSIGTFDAEQVLVAVPPRVLEATVTFAPAVSAATSALWRSTPTWMASQAKCFAVYDEPFWLADGLSGTAQSMVGPMVEIHDATTSSGRAALFGFLGVAPAQRREIGEAQLVAACVSQLERMFGVRAATPSAVLLQDWATDPRTATPADEISNGHPAPAAPWIDGPWGERVTLAGSEVSPTEAGYLAGAIEASERAADEVLRRLASR